MFNYEQVHLNSKHRLDKTYLYNLHPNFKEIGHSGNIITKNDLYFIELNTFDYEIIDFEYKSLSDNCRLSVYTLINYTTNRNSRRSSLWLWYDDDWKLYFHQGTPLN
ncbi:hypothetical protein [Staphylococcus haemolyticus]|uniref:nuclear transport factor 2 family protein n=1 Tax=Staphylococcus haemolyticus TaxID=1283 RepID=UPI001E647D8C|nr:hypothetical protein [Staphylococcus haemolyticus]MCC3661182.1 hypothetical protein [Staphylococcus haemolyticus]